MLLFNSTLYLSSDRLVDQNNRARKKFGSKRLINLLEESSDSNVKIDAQKVEIQLDEYMNGVPQRDDITLVTIKV